ncbi:MAG: alpha-amylase family glycosyl hydrolase [Actinomycetes bacterium]
MTQAGSSRAVKWWEDAVFYHIYPRSFAAAAAHDDGTGDLAGITGRLGYLSDLGVGALWLCPVFASPGVDHGYDVSDYCAIDPTFGSEEDLDELLDQAHRRGLRVILDIVPSHTSKNHRWFERALAEGPGSEARSHYLFRDGRGDSGQRAPTDVLSSFGDSAWTRVIEADGNPGQWYFHIHDPDQPDLNWAEPSVLAEFEAILSFWLNRGVDGFRLDVADHLTKDVSRTDAVTAKELLEHSAGSRTHVVLKSFRTLVESFPGDRTLVGEVGATGTDAELYSAPDELPMIFNFPFMHAGWNAGELRRTIDDALRLRARTGATPAWVTDSHDERRSPSRYSDDLAVGTRRAQAMALLLLSLPGASFLYQGQELGLPNVDDLPEDRLRDPMWERSGHTRRGRDGCRIPLPWSGQEPPFGFTGTEAAPGSAPTPPDTWLPQPRWFADYTVDRQLDDPASMLRLYTGLLSLRHAHACLRRGTVTWLETPADVLAFDRRSEDETVRVVVNLSSQDIALPPGNVIACSAPGLANRIDAGGTTMPPDTAVWCIREGVGPIA